MIEILKLAGGILAIVSVLVIMSGFLYSLATRILLSLPGTIDLGLVPKFYGVFWMLMIVFIISVLITEKFQIVLIDLSYFLIYGYLLHVSIKCFLKESEDFIKNSIHKQEARKNKERLYNKLSLLIVFFLVSDIGLAWYSIKEYKIIFIQMLTNSLPIEHLHEQATLISQLFLVFLLYLMILFIFGNFHGCYVIYKFEKYRFSARNNDKLETFEGYLVGKNNDFFIIKKAEDLNSDIVYIKKDLIESIKLGE